MIESPSALRWGIPGYLRILHRRAQGTRTEADDNSAKLFKVAGLDPAQLNDLLSQDHEEQQLANRASSVVTRKIRELWTERQLAVRFNLDAQHFDTVVQDRTPCTRST